MPIEYRTRGNATPERKPRVYFTCHPADFDRSFDRIAADLTAACDCAVYYTPDMTEVIPDRDTDLGRMNLFVIPVTFRLLSQPNRAMDEDFAFANREHIPVLPIMMEPGIDAVYARPDKFGERQYLRPDSADLTEISYAEKLKKYLSSVLVSDETAARVRAAFDAYIFLSYRKKDRRCANELLRLIHEKPGFRDIAVWYDEFLTPGESFDKNIRRALADSKLFTLLVTPHVLEEGNFVQREEYPAARQAQMPILPAEMEKTDPAALGEKFAELPPCVDPRDDAAFLARLTKSLTLLARADNDGDPAHTYLIGLAYLEGIDVEVNRERALGMIKSAAEAGLAEAIVKLWKMYAEGIGVPVDYREARKWAQSWTERYTELYGEEDERTMQAMDVLALTSLKNGDYQAALELNEKICALRLRVLGEEHPDTLTTLGNLAASYGGRGNYHKERQLEEKVYALRCRILGEEDPRTLTTLNNLAATCGEMGDHQKARELKEKVYALRQRILGEEHPDTLTALNNLAMTCHYLGEQQKAREHLEKAYTLTARALGEEHPDTLTALSNLAAVCSDLGERQKALELKEKACVLNCRILGEEHPYTLTSLSNLALEYFYLGEYQRALELMEKTYALRLRVHGEEHLNTLASLSNLAVTYSRLGEQQKAREYQEKLCTLRRRILGEAHPDTVDAMNCLTVTYSDLGEHQKARELAEKAYALSVRVLGEEHPHTMDALNNLAATYSDLGEQQKARELARKLYALRRRVLGKNHPDTKAAKKLKMLLWFLR